MRVHRLADHDHIAAQLQMFHKALGCDPRYKSIGVAGALFSAVMAQCEGEALRDVFGLRELQLIEIYGRRVRSRISIGTPPAESNARNMGGEAI